MSNLLDQSISLLYRYGQIFLSRQLKEDGLGPGQLHILLTLQQMPGASQEDLVHALRADKGTVSAALKKLVLAGWVDKIRNPTDRRAFHLTLTPRSLEKIDQWNRMINEWEEILLQGIPQDVQAKGREFLSQMARNADIYLLKERAKDGK